MVFSSEDKIFIKNLVLLKGYSSSRLIKEFPQKGWNKNCLDVLLGKIRKTNPPDFQPLTDGLRRHLEARVHGIVHRGTWGEGQRRLLQECSVDGDVASDLGMSSDFFIFQQDSAPQHIKQRTPLRWC